MSDEAYEMKLECSGGLICAPPPKGLRLDVPTKKFRQHNGYQHVILWMLYFMLHEERKEEPISWRLKNPVNVVVQYP